MFYFSCCRGDDPSKVEALIPGLRKDYELDKTAHVALNIFGALLTLGGTAMIVVFTKVVVHEDSLALAFIGGVITTAGLGAIFGGNYYHSRETKYIFDRNKSFLSHNAESSTYQPQALNPALTGYYTSSANCHYKPPGT